MNGTTGSYAMNGTRLSLQPTYGNWQTRQELGRDGNNRPLYPAIREFEMGWDLMPTSDLKQIIDAQLTTTTGTVVFDLPKWGDTLYTYYSYSGTIVNEVTVGQYFAEHVQNVRLIVSNIRTN